MFTTCSHTPPMKQNTHNEAMFGNHGIAAVVMEATRSVTAMIEWR